MFSRRSRIQEKRTTRKGITLLFLSAVLLILLVIFGIPTLVKLAGFAGTLKSNESMLSQDKTPPAPPQLEEPPPRFSREGKVAFSGRSEADSIVIVIQNDVAIQEIKVGNTSKFTASVSLLEGENSITFLAKDQAGNQSGNSPTYKISFDLTPPELTISKPEDGASFYPPEQTVTFEGKTEKDTQIKINDRLVIVSQDGSFSQKIKLSEGENSFTVVAEDSAENKTEKTLKVSYTP